MYGAAMDLGLGRQRPDQMLDDELKKRRREQGGVADPRPSQYGDVTLSAAAKDLFGNIGL